MLGSAHDGEVLSAARHIDALIKASGAGWDAIIPDLEAPAPSRPRRADQDLILLDQLLKSEKVSEVLKLRLHDMREALRRGTLADADRRLLRILHRKAVIDGAVVTE